ncbi:MAG TPA: dienelactone hydrolase family protein, partial [Gammaproteobacteria bacterium]|nr:dienelactone hydrolase family protein [Gammaproteobacteria bacterium]
MHTLVIEYSDNENLFKGSVAYSGNEKKPGVLIVHDWGGCNDFARQTAEQIAELGYVGFAIDMFGQGKTGNTKEEKSALIAPLVNDRQLLLKRIQTALVTLKTMPMVDPNKIAAMGFCFGGLCALDLARSGSELQGVVSFHGLLHAPEDAKNHA